MNRVTHPEKRTDIKLSVFTAVHGSIRSIDHLTDVLKTLGLENFENLKLHRTKCSKIIINVVAPAMLEETVADIGEQYFSLIIDESTDCSKRKYLAYCVRYYSVVRGKIVTDFLGFSELVTATAQQLLEHFEKFLKDINLKIEHLIALGTDGGSNLVGKHNGLFALLKKKLLPNLQLFRCVSHSLHTYAGNACEEMPASLEFMLRESNGWFAHSTIRQVC